ncbi:hypothetical protein MKX03_014917 [Papaver bracteatum]|nr:hypothetical protein MKX03_014917 [Papaver bracteatum]
MVFSRISSTILRRNPFTSISSISSSPSSNFNLTTISKFHPQIFSNPRITDFFQVRQFSGETPSLIAQEKKNKKKSPVPTKKLAEYRLKLDEAYQAIEMAKDSKRSWVYWPCYKQDAERANDAVNIAFKEYTELVSMLGEDERKAFEKSSGWIINEILDLQEKTMNDELMNFKEVLKMWNMATFGEENPKESGGTACQENHHGFCFSE